METNRKLQTVPKINADDLNDILHKEEQRIHCLLVFF